MSVTRPSQINGRRCEKYPLVALAQDESENANASKSTESPKCLRELEALVCFLISCSAGVVLAGSYLVKPVQRACPEWKESTTVIGEAVMMSVIGLAAIPQGEVVHYWSSRTFFFTRMLLYASMGFGMGGIAVATCEKLFSRLVTVLFSSSPKRWNRFRLYRNVDWYNIIRPILFGNEEVGRQ